MKTRHWLAFAALCLLSGSAWMIDQFYPEILTGPIHNGAHDGLLAILFAILSLRSRSSLTPRLWLELALAGIALLALPTILSTGAGGQVASLTIILISTLIPAIVVFLIAQSNGSSTNDNPMRLLLPALAGLGGAALLLPFTWPLVLIGKSWLIAIIISAVLSAIAAIRLHRILPQMSILRALAILCAAAAIASALCYRIGYSGLIDWTGTQLLVEILRCLLLEAPILYLLVYLLRELNPIAISTRYLLVPLVTIVESYLIEHPHASWTDYAGAILMASSAFAVIRTAPREIPLDNPL